MKAIEAAARALSPHLRFYGDGQGHAVTIADKTIKAYLTALAEDDAAVERVARAMLADELTVRPTLAFDPAWQQECDIWLSNARAAIRAMGGE